MEAETEKRLISQQHALSYLGGITEMTLWRWRQDPRLNFPKPYVIRRRNFYDVAELDSWLKRQRCAVLAGGEQ
jgi:hypothetical protein